MQLRNLSCQCRTEYVADATLQLHIHFEGYKHTITFGYEGTILLHRIVSEALIFSLFFANPYHSWRKGATRIPMYYTNYIILQEMIFKP